MLKEAVTSEDLSEILFRIPEAEMDATHSRHWSSDSVVRAALTAYG